MLQPQPFRLLNHIVTLVLSSNYYILSLPVSCATVCVLARASDAALSALVFLSILCLWLSSFSYKFILAKYNTYLHMCACMYAYTDSHTDTHTYKHTQMHARTYACTCPRTHACTHTHTYIHTQSSTLYLYFGFMIIKE